MNIFHKKTLEKVSTLYKKIYNRTLDATEKSDSINEVYAYIRLSDRLKEAYEEFREFIEDDHICSVCKTDGCNNSVYLYGYCKECVAKGVY